MTDRSKGIDVHFRIIMLQRGNYFCKLGCWTTPSYWDGAQAKFDELVPNLR